MNSPILDELKIERVKYGKDEGKLLATISLKAR
jgi:hypothetical protein